MAYCADVPLSPHSFILFLDLIILIIKTGLKKDINKRLII